MIRLSALALSTCLSLSLPVASVAQDAAVSGTSGGKIAIASCPTGNSREYAVCLRERRVVRAARALNDILAISLGGDPTAGGAADCAQAAEDDCANMLEDVGSLSYDDGICIWTCKAFTTGGGSD